MVETSGLRYMYFEGTTRVSKDRTAVKEKAEVHQNQKIFRRKISRPPHLISSHRISFPTFATGHGAVVSAPLTTLARLHKFAAGLPPASGSGTSTNRIHVRQA